MSTCGGAAATGELPAFEELPSAETEEAINGSPRESGGGHAVP